LKFGRRWQFGRQQRAHRHTVNGFPPQYYILSFSGGFTPPLKSFFLGNQGGIFGAGSGSGNIFDNYSWHFVIFVVLFLPLKQSKTLKSVESFPLKNEKLPEPVEPFPLKNEKLPEPGERVPLKTEENPFSGGHDTQKKEPRCHL